MVVFVVIAGSLLFVDADEHEHTVRQLLRGRLKRGALKIIMDVCALCNLLTVVATLAAYRKAELQTCGLCGLVLVGLD